MNEDNFSTIIKKTFIQQLIDFLWPYFVSLCVTILACLYSRSAKILSNTEYIKSLSVVLSILLFTTILFFILWVYSDPQKLDHMLSENKIKACGGKDEKETPTT